MKVAAAFCLITALGMGGAYFTQDTITQEPITVIQEVSPLERARQATFLLLLPDFRTSGSATLVGRKKLEDGKYLYRALTAHHVVDDMAKGMAENKLKASHKVELMFQPSFHGKPLRMNLNIDDIDWAIPAHDWATFTFTSNYKLPCVEVATEEEFKAMKAFDRIYAVGCGAGYGQQVREGIMGATHNEYIDLKEQLTHCQYPWCKNPERFFRPAVNIWYGDSGGAIYNKSGKLIGIINGFSRGGVSHLAIALKAHTIHDVVMYSPDFFLVED